MSELRQRMIEAMRQRGFSVRTHQAYLAAITELSRYYRRSPARLSAEEVKAYLRHLAVDRELSASSCRQQLHAARFFYEQVLDRRDMDLKVALPKQRQRLPELLTRAEVSRLLATCTNPKHRTLLATCYGCGLRVSELVAIRVRQDIDGERGLLRVEQGKGGKDRLVPIGPQLLEELRIYWRHYRPPVWLFCANRSPDRPLSIATCQQVFQRVKGKAGIEKVGGIHSLRHAYATHQLQAGVSLQDLQHYLGHTSLRTTQGYLHWVPDYHEGHHRHDLLAELPGSGRGAR